MNIATIMAFESGDLSDEDTIVMFQELINSGDAWRLQGSYGRAARDLILAGLCTLPATGEQYVAQVWLDDENGWSTLTIGTHGECDAMATRRNQDGMTVRVLPADQPSD